MGNIELFFDKILIKPDPIPKEVQLGGIVMMNNRTEEQITTGRVMVMGPDTSLPLEVGDRLVYSPWSGFMITLGGEKFKLLSSHEVLARLTGEDDEQDAVVE